MNRYDVVIAGAGPAGGAAARALSKTGFKVLLLEKALSFAVNDFSSGGAPVEILTHFQLPDEVVGAFCRQIHISATDDAHLWQSDEAVAVVLDFKQLRLFLAGETEKNGSEVRLGWAYEGYRRDSGLTFVMLKNTENGAIEHVETRVLMDATGSERCVLGRNTSGHDRLKNERIVGKGIEYLVEVPVSVYQAHAACLSFFIGSHWMPQGYGWIFPMKPNRLKIGVGRNFPGEQAVPHQESLVYYLDRLIRDRLKTDEITILDRHGKTISYTCHPRDTYFDENVIVIGDAVSTVNPLTFEGIRHALASGEIAAKHVQAFLDHTSQDFKRYRTEMRRYCGMRWIVSALLAKKIYREPDDEKMSLMLRALKGLPLEGLKALMFDYQHQAAGRFYAAYQLLLLKQTLSFGVRRRSR